MTGGLFDDAHEALYHGAYGVVAAYLGRGYDDVELMDGFLKQTQRGCGESHSGLGAARSRLLMMIALWDSGLLEVR